MNGQLRELRLCRLLHPLPVQVGVLVCLAELDHFGDGVCLCGDHGTRRRLFLGDSENLGQCLGYSPLRIRCRRIDPGRALEERGDSGFILNHLGCVLVRRDGPSDVYNIIVDNLLRGANTIVRCIHYESQLHEDFFRDGVSGPPCLSNQVPLFVARTRSLQHWDVAGPDACVLRQDVALSNSQIESRADECGQRRCLESRFHFVFLIKL